MEESKFYVVCQEYGRNFRNKARRKWLWRIVELPLSFTPEPSVMVYGPFNTEREAGAAMIAQWHEQEELLEAEED